MKNKIILSGQGTLETNLVYRYGMPIKEISIKIGDRNLIDVICEKLEYNHDETIPNKSLGDIEIIVKQDHKRKK